MNVRPRTRKVPIIVIVAGLLLALVHLVLGISGIMTTFQWVSGVVLGLLVAGAGNHIRIFGRR
jgi:hypothetical protein